MTQPRISINLEPDKWRSIVYWLIEAAREHPHVAQPRRLAERVSEQLRTLEVSIDPYRAAERGLAAASAGDISEAIAEIGHGLAALARQVNGEPE